MTDARKVAAAFSLKELGRREARRNAVIQCAAGAILLLVGYLTAASGYGDVRGPAHPACAAVILVGGLVLCVQAMFVVFRALLAQYEHFPMSAEEANFSLYEFRVSAALVLTGARLLIPLRPVQVLLELALAAILLYCAVTRALAADWKRVRTAAQTLPACAAGIAALALIWCVATGASWSLTTGIAAIGFGFDSFYCALRGA